MAIRMAMPRRLHRDRGCLMRGIKMLYCLSNLQEGMPSSIAVPSSWSFHVSIMTKGRASSGEKYFCQRLEVSAKVWPQRAEICRFSPHEALLSSKLDHAAPTTILSEYLASIVL